MRQIARSPTELRLALENIPIWKKLFICFVQKPKLHKLARAYSVVTVDLIKKNDPRMEEFWKRSDELWAEVYGIEYDPS